MSRLEVPLLEIRLLFDGTPTLTAANGVLVVEKQ
jgi:hypothetical protein